VPLRFKTDADGSCKKNPRRRDGAEIPNIPAPRSYPNIVDLDVLPAKDAALTALNFGLPQE